MAQLQQRVQAQNTHACLHFTSQASQYHTFQVHFILHWVCRFLNLSFPKWVKCYLTLRPARRTAARRQLCRGLHTMTTCRLVSRHT
jgi:hypothetical protein